MENYVTWNELFQFGLFLIGVLSLAYEIFHNKKKYPPKTHKLNG